ncbi:TIGR03084 family metal-binding protein [Nonomuraea typhae]|uniref:TIGR03084 family metal-binding protein n=1 Tax=Nonomuraea typhae TaxID=2603600 RepID=A0ABW7YL77_9ACTN
MDLMRELVADLRAETASLQALLSPLEPAGWELPTPAQGWAIRDQISHLAYFDDAAVTAAADPAAFRAAAAALTSADEPVERARSMTPADVHAWFGTARAALLATLSGLDARRRLPWYGPDMSAASFATARLMETWAHGHDVADALGVTREPAPRLRHVATIGVRALPYSFVVRGLAVPERPVRVELTMPGGGLWTAGPEGVPDVVRGPMLDFCLLVTQRAHRDDTALEVSGETAAAWTAIAQAFAGPPGRGRAPSGKARMP